MLAYVAGQVHYDFQSKDANNDRYHSFRLWEYDDRDPNYNGDHISLTAHTSRFGIKSKIDTAIGQIRTTIEADFWRGEGSGVTPAGDPVLASAIRDFLRLRHAYGEWDMTPNWTFSMGQRWQTASLLPIGISTVDFSGPAGVTYDRTAQIRLTYTDGPLSWAVAIENPTFDSKTNMPNIASYIQYDIAGGHQVIVTGVLRHGYETALCACYAAILIPMAAWVSRPFCSARI